MKKAWVAGIALTALIADCAWAAEIPVKAPPLVPLPPPPTVSWTGCNLNAGVGYGLWDQVVHSEQDGVRTSIDRANGGRGWLGRLGAGCDYQMTGGLSNWVLGAFGDYDFMGLKGTNLFSLNLANGGEAIPIQGDEKQTGAWYVGGRAGYLITPYLMTYLDGGWTETRFDQINFVIAATGGPVVGSPFLPATTYHGWFIGGGTEYTLNFSWLPIQGLFWRNEYRYASYQAEDIPLVRAPFTGLGENSRKYVQTITSSVVWRFDWW